MIRAVLFDLGGTLHVCTTDEKRKLWFAQRLLSRLSEYGIVLNMSPEALARQLEENGRGYKAHVEESMRELEPVQIWDEYYLRQQHLGRERLAPVAEELSFLYDYERVCNLRRPGLLDCMQALKQDGLRLGIISNIISRTLVPHLVLEYGLDPYMECVLTSAGTGIRKPDPEIFRMAEKAMHLRPEEMAYVGDTLSRDVRGVRNAGWRLVIQIASPSSWRRDAGMAELGYQADYEIRELTEIPEIICRENERE